MYVFVWGESTQSSPLWRRGPDHGACRNDKSLRLSLIIGIWSKSKVDVWRSICVLRATELPSHRKSSVSVSCSLAEDGVTGSIRLDTSLVPIRDELFKIWGLIGVLRFVLIFPSRYSNHSRLWYPLLEYKLIEPGTHILAHNGHSISLAQSNMPIGLQHLKSLNVSTKTDLCFG